MYSSEQIQKLKEEKKFLENQLNGKQLEQEIKYLKRRLSSIDNEPVNNFIPSSSTTKENYNNIVSAAVIGNVPSTSIPLFEKKIEASVSFSEKEEEEEEISFTELDPESSRKYLEKVGPKTSNMSATIAATNLNPPNLKKI
jgi:hypothetical protein